MRKPRPTSVTTKSYWESLSDRELLDAEMTTDDPDALPGIVDYLPVGYEAAHVEYKYDLRKTGREPFVCVHGKHPHRAGFVMNLNGVRFKFGWMCAEQEYGTDFKAYKADFEAALNRRDTLRRKRDIESMTLPFMDWLDKVWCSDIFKLYESVRSQFEIRMPWIAENTCPAAFMGYAPNRVAIPYRLFDPCTDPRAEFGKVVAEMSAHAANLIRKDDLNGASVQQLKKTLSGFFGRIEALFETLKEVEEFFQPVVLEAICRFANECDNPKKRTYTAGLMAITCKRERDKVVINVPANYRLPDRAGLDAFKEALRVL